MLAVAHAVDAIVAEINRVAGHPLVPPVTWSYEIDHRAHGDDRTLSVCLIFWSPRIWYKTPRVSFRPSAACDGHAASSLNSAIIGSDREKDATVALPTTAPTKSGHPQKLANSTFEPEG